MRNERFTSASKISLPVPSGALSGQAVKTGPFIGVLATDEGKGGNIAGRATVWRTGEYDLATTDAVSAELTAIYITSSNVLTTTATSNTLFGYSHHDADGNGGTKSSGAGTIHVILA